MAYLSLHAKPGGITVQRVVHPDFTGITLKLVDEHGSEVNISISDGTVRPQIFEQTAYITDDQCEDSDNRARYPLFVPQVTDEDIWLMNQHTERDVA